MMNMEPQENTLHFEIKTEQAGQRIDKILAELSGEFSRSRIKQLIESNHVHLHNRLLTDPSYKVKAGDICSINVPEPEKAVPAAQKIPLTILYEDQDLIVIDKAPGMVVHPAPGSPDRTLVNALLAHCGESLSGIGGVRRPGIVHRIDKDTSGLLVIAKNDATHQYLSHLFSTHDIARAYRCVVWGLPSPKEGIIEGNIGRHRTDRKKMAILKSGGKEAITEYQTEQAFGLGASLLTCRLQTGRTHQIRVHLSAIGHPLIGDPLYGRKSPARKARLDPIQLEAALAFPRQALHAAELGFIHPRTRKELFWESSLPDDMVKLIKDLS